ncbi:MAG: COX15/CtaA family protein [Legionellaceae bacterium]|nr:COX15/CtaA family protein [Legionellaceae bacterium]
MQLNKIRWAASIAVVLALFVVMLGAYTRLTDAGLGCPDWPGCYGKMVLPSATDVTRVDAQAMYPDIPIESQKAWTEMAHRYAAGTLGVLILLLAVVARFGPKEARVSGGFSVVLVGLLFFQAALGMWTVTLKLLPVVVMGHLLGGMTLAALLTWYRWHLSAFSGNHLKRFSPWVGLGIGVVFCQIVLGGWVSANYAGLACIGFPTCNQHWLPAFDWVRAFDVFSPIGANYQGGALDLAARVTVQWVHRMWALVTALYVIGLAGALLRIIQVGTVRCMAMFTLGLVLLQCLLGVMNVVYMLPLAVAVAHNGVALLLLMSMVSLYYLVSGRRS